MTATSFQLGCAGVSHARERVLAIANFSSDSLLLTEAKTETKEFRRDAETSTRGLEGVNR